jgi:hypothetical protein
MSRERESVSRKGPSADPYPSNFVACTICHAACTADTVPRVYYLGIRNRRCVSKGMATGCWYRRCSWQQKKTPTDMEASTHPRLLCRIRIPYVSSPESSSGGSRDCSVLHKLQTLQFLAATQACFHRLRGYCNCLVQLCICIVNQRTVLQIMQIWAICAKLVHSILQRPFVDCLTAHSCLRLGMVLDAF